MFFLGCSSYVSHVKPVYQIVALDPICGPCHNRGSMDPAESGGGTPIPYNGLGDGLELLRQK